MMDTSRRNFWEIASEMRAKGRPFAIATVVAVRGSASARISSKAIFDEDGKNIWGWVGGGCAEIFVSQNCLESIRDQEARIIQADLDDEILGLGIPCGGIMDIFIDPQIPPETLPIRCEKQFKEAVAHLSRGLGFSPQIEDEPNRRGPFPCERMIWQMTHALAKHRGKTLTSLQGPPSLMKPDPLKNELLVLGQGRIVEEIARIACLLSWPLRIYGLRLDRSNYPLHAKLQVAEDAYADLRIEPHSTVIVASHHRGDQMFIQKALAAEAAYIGMVASRKRAGLVREYLEMAGVASIDRLRSPAGLDLGCRNPQEIALSCIAEIIALKNDWLPFQIAENHRDYPGPKARWDAVPPSHSAPHGL